MDFLYLLAQDAGGGGAEPAGEAGPGLADPAFWEKWLDPKVLGDLAVELGKSLFTAILIFVIGRWVAGMLVRGLRRFLTNRHVDATLVGFFANIVHAALLIVVVMAALEALSVDTNSVTAMIAAAGLAVGFALQGSLSNFAAGVLMIFFKPLRVGDLVSAGGTFGVVQEVALFCTMIDTPDGKRVIVPNNSITGGNIENLTTNGRIRVDMTFGIGYGSDVDTAKAILMRILEADPRVLEDPAPKVAMVAHGDSSVNFVCRPWVVPADYWSVWFDTHEAVKKAFDAEGVEIPFPQRDVHLHQAA